MSTQVLTSPSTPLLSDAAAQLVIPDGIVTTGWAQVEAKGREVGIGFDWWQQSLGRLVLGKRADGKYAATVGGVVMSIPRQVGKTYFVGAILVLMCLIWPGYKVVWTAHRTRTATNTFRSLQSMVKRKKIWPHVAAIRTANGEQEISFRNGSVIMFGAREQGFGRGFDEVDVEVFDEAQILTEKALEDMVAATNQSRHPHGALLFYMGTPPRPVDPGEAFTAKRRKAIDRKSPDTLYLECSADRGSDPDDRDQWAQANFSFPDRTPLESMLRLRENLVTDEAWLREAMGIWDEFDELDRPIRPERWGELAIPDDEVPSAAPSRYALTMSPDRVASIAVGIKGDEVDYLDLAELARVDDSRKLLDWIVKRCGRTVPLMVDSRDPAASFISELRARGVQVNATSASDAGRACGALVDAVDESRVSHCDQPAIRAALAAAEKKDIGKAGLWEWALEDQMPEVAALRALTLAHYGLSFTRPKAAPPRRLR
jgi:hypothetical protein